MSLPYFLHRIICFLLPDGIRRTKYIEKHHLFKETGKNFYFCPRKLPADPKLIKFHDNVAVATDVMFINHDVAQKVFNFQRSDSLPKFFGCIEVGNNVFIGARATILPNVRICDNVYIAAGALVTKSITEAGIWGGVPARRIGDVERLYEERLAYQARVYDANPGQYHENLWEEFYSKNMLSGGGEEVIVLFRRIEPVKSMEFPRNTYSNRSTVNLIRFLYRTEIARHRRFL